MADNSLGLYVFGVITALLLLAGELPQSTARLHPHSLRRLTQVAAASADAAVVAPISISSGTASEAVEATATPGAAAVEVVPAPVPAADGASEPAPAADAAAGVVATPVTASAADVDLQHHRYTPKLYLYAWCGVTYAEQKPGVGPADNNDYIATIDATPGASTFGSILSVTSTPYSGTEAHHCNVDITGKWLGAGGLLSFTKANTPDIFIFNLENPAKPAYRYGLTSTSGSCMDEFVADKSGGFFVSSMCGRDGHPGGGVVWLDPGSRRPKLYEYDGKLTAEQKKIFASHGVDIDYSTGHMVTADYLDVLSAVLPPLRMMHTAHVWNTRTMKVERVVDLSGITDGLMESRYSGYPGLFWVSGGMGKLHLINTKTGAVTPNVYCLDDTCQTVNGTCLTTSTFDGPRGKRMLVTSMSLAQMRLVDVSNPRKLKTLDTYNLGAGAGAHVVKFDLNTWTAAVATYLLDIEGTVLHFPSDQTVRLFYINLNRDKIVPYATKVDFKTDVPSKGSSNCHGMAFNYRPYGV